MVKSRIKWDLGMFLSRKAENSPTVRHRLAVPLGRFQSDGKVSNFTPALYSEADRMAERLTKLIYVVREIDSEVILARDSEQPALFRHRWLMILDSPARKAGRSR